MTASSTSSPGPHTIAVMGWQAISHLGLGVDAVRANPTAPVTTLQPAHGDAADYPQDIAYRPAAFDVAALLGAKGIRTMDRTTALAVCAAKLLNEDQSIDEGLSSEQVGFVVGTTTGSIRSTSDFTRDSLVQERPFLVNPALFPNTVMNCAAGQCAIRFKARCVNATISGGRLSGLLALKYASQMLRRRYAERLFTGSVEELCPQSAWAHRSLVQHGSRHALPLGEGGAMFSLERSDAALARGTSPAAHIVALQYGRWFDADTDNAQAAHLSVLAHVQDALQGVGMAAESLDAAVLCGAADAASSPIEQGVAAALLRTGAPVFGLEWVQQLGDTYSATVSLGLAQLLSVLRDGQTGLILIVGADGHAGCVLVQVPHTSGR